MNWFATLKKKRYYKFLIWIFLIICLVFLFWRGSLIVTSPEWLKIDDYVEYWAAGQLNIFGGNPYNPDQLLPLQNEAGRYFGVPVMMWNPPWMLALVMPFSLFEYPISRTLWILFFIVITFVSSTLIWSLYGGKPRSKWIGWMITFTFIPVLQAFRTGQTGPLLLLGIVGFLFFLRKDKLFLAGVSLSLLAVKPHILYLYVIAILIWSLSRKEWRLVLGTGASLMVATMIAAAVNINVLQQYLDAFLNYPPENWATPTLGGVIRLIFGPELFWAQFFPPLIGILWLIYYWIKQREMWDWIEVTPILILVSIFTAAYGWTSDQSVSLVAVLQIFILLIPLANNSTRLFVGFSYLIIDLLLILPWGNQIWLWWLAPALLVWYLFSKRAFQQNISPPSSNENNS